MNLPTFLIIGAQKSGTTALYHYLSQHPDIYMSPEKEPRFLAFDGPELGEYRLPAVNFEEYRSLFAGRNGEKAAGEASVAYFVAPAAPARIAHYLPDAKLIVLLRNPVQRAFSHFRFNVMRGVETVTDFGMALDLEAGRAVQGPHYCQYRNTGFYTRHLEKYSAWWGNGRMQIHLQEELLDSPQSVLRQVFRFLEVDDSFQADTSQRHNVSSPGRIKALQNLVSGESRAHSLKKLIPPRWRTRLSAKLINLNQAVPPMSAEVREDLLQGYRHEVLKLQAMLGRDLSDWLK